MVRNRDFDFGPLVDEIAARRRAANLSHAQLSERAGLSEKYSYLCETKRRLPSAQAAYRLAKAVGMSASEISSYFEGIGRRTLLAGFTDELSKLAGMTDNSDIEAAVRVLIDNVIEHGLEPDQIRMLGRMAGAMKKAVR